MRSARTAWPIAVTSRPRPRQRPRTPGRRSRSPCSAHAPKDRWRRKFRSTSSARRNLCSRAMSSTNSRPFNRPRNGLRWRRRSKTTLSLVIRPSRDSGEANPHPDHAGARRRAEGKARLRFRLTCVTRIFQKSVFTKFAHGRRLAAGVAERWSREPGYGDVRGDVLALRIAGFLHFDCYLIVIFLGAHRRREPQSAALRTTPDCRRRLTSWRHRESRLGPARTCAAEKKKFHGLGGGRHCFSLWFTMRVVADRACNHSPKLSAKGDRWRGAP